MHAPLLITARLTTPLAGDPPQLDGLGEYLLSLHHHKGDPGYKVDRNFPAPDPGQIPIPMRRDWIEGHLVALCSDPILATPAIDSVEHVAKRIGVERSEMLAPDRRTVVATTNSWTKSYRLPLRIRSVPMVRWFALGDRRELLCLLRRCPALGKKISVGYGRVSEWTIERVESDGPHWPWWIATEHGLLLMKTLPLGDYLPSDLIGARQDFGAASPPYWHPERYAQIMKPR